MTETDKAVEDDLQRILQSDFVESYCEEYNTDTLHDLPYGWKDLRRIASRDGAFSYRNFYSSLEALHIRELIELLAAESMMAIRGRPGYLSFIAKYRSLANDREALKAVAADYGHRYGHHLEAIRAATELRTMRGRDCVLTSSEVDQLDEVLSIVAGTMPGSETITSQAPVVASRDLKEKDGEMRNKRVAIFVALREERQVLERSNLGLTRNQHSRHLVGERNGVTIEVYCPYAMGRVAAAVATMEYLHSANPKPDLLIVAGLAGGFEAAGVREGAVMVPEQIFDLALRKVQDHETDEFRVEGYRADQRLKNYLQSNLFNEKDWAAAAHEAAEWPPDRRPNIRHEPLTSVDEVVSSLDHVEDLRKAFPKLAGVEMEAGGVFAAALKLEVRVAVIRAISDKADPSKADNEWRGRAMKTIVSLLEFIDLAKMLEN